MTRCFLLEVNAEVGEVGNKPVCFRFAEKASYSRHCNWEKSGADTGRVEQQCCHSFSLNVYVCKKISLFRTVLLQRSSLTFN